MTPVAGLLFALAGFTIYYLQAWWRGVARARTAPDAPAEAQIGGAPTPLQVVVGFVTNFFDTLGIGSFAPTTAAFKFMRMVPDRLIPGTLNVGHTLGAVTQTFIFTLVIDVDVTTLALMILAAVLGAKIGAGVVAGWPKRYVQIGMGTALIVAAALFAWRNLVETGMLTGDNAALVTGGSGLEGTIGLEGVRLAIGLAGNFVLGALMTLGIGLYAPCMILVGLLGMNAKTAYPIMMGSCAFLMPLASVTFIRRHAYALRPAMGLALGAVPAVLIAAYLVSEMPILYVRWLVVGVVLIAATMMLRSAARGE